MWCLHCKRRIMTGDAVVSIGYYCLIKYYKDLGCPEHEKGELVVKKNWIGVKNCQDCLKVGKITDRDKIIIIWKSKITENMENTKKEEITGTILTTDPSGGGGKTEGKKGTSAYMIFRRWDDWEIGSWEDENWQTHATFFQNLVKKENVKEWAIESAGNWVNVSKSKFVGSSYVMLLKAIGALHFIGYIENIKMKEILNMNVSQWENKALNGEIVGLKKTKINIKTETFNKKGIMVSRWTFKNNIINDHEKDAVLIFYIYWCQVKKNEWPWKSWD